MRACPICQFVNRDEVLFCSECQAPLARGGPNKPARELTESAKEAQRMRESLSATGPSSWDLTDQQWYNVCKFFPSVAKRALRPVVKVGPNEPLDALSRMGPLLTSFALPIDARQPGEDDE